MHQVSRQALKHLNKAEGVGAGVGAELVTLLQNILGKGRQIYTEGVDAMSVKLAICFYLKSKRFLQISKRPSFVYLKMHHTGTKASFPSKMQTFVLNSFN